MGIADRKSNPKKSLDLFYTERSVPILISLSGKHKGI